MNALVVPLRLDALVVSDEPPMLAPLLDFERMPFSELGVDVNPDVPFLASELSAEPFADASRTLDRGCHLHWALPSFLTSTSPLATAQKSKAGVTTEDPQFPPVPDRWMVRRISKNLGNALWLVESDCFSTARNSSVVYPLRTDAEHGVKTVFLGRTTRLDLNHPASPAAPQGPLNGYLGYLTAVGYGDPNFHAFYPNCRSVFGLYDPEATLNARGDLRYELIGWYNDLAVDHFAARLSDLASPVKDPRDGRTRLEQLRAASPDTTLSDAQLLAGEVARQFGWDLSSLKAIQKPADLPSRALFFASVEVTAEPAADAPLPVRSASSRPVVGIANTGTEALSALLSRKVFSDTALAVKLEEQLEALHMAAVLQAHRLDLGQAFQETRHRRGFTAVAGGMTWGARWVPSKGPQQSKDLEDLPEATAGILDQLNSMEATRAAIAQELERNRSQIHSDWYKYMITAYPVPGVVEPEVFIDDIVNYVKDVGLEEANVSAVLLRSTGLDIEQRRTLTAQHLMPGKLEILQRPGPRFWQPNEPVVMLSGHADATDRYGQDDPLSCSPLQNGATDPGAWLMGGPTAAFDGIIAAVKPTQRSNGLTMTDGAPQHPFLLEWEVELFPVKPGSNLDRDDRAYAPDYLSANFQFDKARLLDLFSQAETLKAASIYNGRSILTPNAPIKLQSEMEAFFKERVNSARLAAFFSQQQGVPTDRVQRDLWLADHWSLFAAWYLNLPNSLAKTMNGNYIETCLSKLDGVASFYDASTKAIQIVAIRAVTSDDILRQCYTDLGLNADPKLPLSLENALAFVDWYRRELHLIEFLAVYRDHVDDMNHVLSQSLSGFNDALLMHRQAFNLPIADPMGFPDYQAFTTMVANTVGSEHRAIPQPLNSFLPLRAGLFKVHALRLIDTFGRAVQDVDESSVAYPSTWLATDGLCHLPPRIVQPLQLDLQWLSPNKEQLANDHPSTSPVCGWVAADDLDDSIAVYAADGTSLGSLDASATGWSPAPGGNITSPDQIANPYLRAAVKGIAARSRAAFVNEMSAGAKSIDPENFEQHQATALLISRPFAVVRAAAWLRTKGPLAINQSWEELNVDMAAGASIQDRNRAGLERLQVDVMLGDASRLNDGVLGLWPEAAASRSAAVSLGPYQPCSPTQQPAIQVTLNKRDPERMILLMDPRAKMHAFTGILPAQELEIPSSHFSGALNRMEVNFLTTPVITGKDLIDLPLMQLEGKAWSWLERRGAVWSETSTEGILQKQVLLNAPELKGHGAAIWDAISLGASKWIVPDPADPNRATVTPVDQRGKAAPAIDADLVAAVEAILASTHIVPPETQNPFQQENMIREGWLKLRNRSDNTMSSK